MTIPTAARAAAPASVLTSSAVAGSDRVSTRLASRILYLEANEDGTVGGSHQALYDLVTRLDRSRYEPVVAFYQENRFAAALRDLGIEVHVLEVMRASERALQLTGGRLAKLRGMGTAIARRVRFLREQRIALLHVNNSPRVGNDDWMPATKFLRIPSIVSVMGDASAALEPNPVKRWLMRSFDHVLPISAYIADAMTRLGFPSSRMDLVMLGVDDEELRARVKRTRAEVRAELGVAEETMLAAMVGNLRPWKGQGVVLAALARIDAATRKHLHVVFVGAARDDDAEYVAELHATVAREGLAGCVSFVGGRTDVPDLVNASDVALHASVKPEPFGLVVIEAMALGKAVVAADRGGPAEILTPESGILYNVERPDALAAALSELVADPSRRAALGAGALARVRHFTIRETVAGIERVYARYLRR